MGLLQTNPRSTRQAVAILALGLMVFGVWLAPACASICAQSESAAASAPPTAPHHHGEQGADHHRTHPAGHDCPMTLCAQLQSAVQAGRPSAVAAPSASPHFAFIAEIPSRLDANRVLHQRLNLAIAGPGPPVPPPLFTVLRS
ncbi:MAG TPA: hypothetical protein VER38_06825 [Candidatus Eisenbacteria bacterium]|nr:hypothetical protein [Candidatus Eisenbacteria bacterium]